MRKFLPIILSVFFFILSVPVIGSAEVSIPDDAYLFEDVQSQYLAQTLSGNDEQSKRERNQFMRANRRIVGKFIKFSYDTKDPKKRTGLYLAPFQTETINPDKMDSALICEVQTSAVKVKTYLEKEFDAKPGDVILVGGRLNNGGFTDMFGGLFGMMSAGSFMYFYINELQNLSASGSGGFGMGMIAIVVIAIVAGGAFYFYKKKKGESVDVNVEDLKVKAEEAKEKASKAFDKFKENVNVDDVKARAEEAKQKANVKLDKLRGFIKKDK